jgi:heparanase 1
MLLNGIPLELGDDGSIPALNPVPAADNLPVYLAPIDSVCSSAEV